MATKKKNKKNTALVSNPAARITTNEVKANGTRKSRGKKTGSRKSTNRRNPSKGQKRARRYRRNSGGASSLVSVVLSSAFGALIINLFDAAVNRLAPTTSAGYRTIAKGVIGIGLLMFGNKLPRFARSYAPVVGGAFIFAGALDVVSTYAMPKILGLLPEPDAPQVVGTVQDKATGQLGTAIRMPDGSRAEVYVQQQAQRPAQNQLGTNYRGSYAGAQPGYGQRRPAMV